MLFYASNHNREICGKCEENIELGKRVHQLLQEVKSLRKLVEHYEHTLEQIAAYKKTIGLKDSPPPMRIVTIILKAEEALKEGEIMKKVDGYFLEMTRQRG